MQASIQPHGMTRGPSEQTLLIISDGLRPFSHCYNLWESLDQEKGQGINKHAIIMQESRFKSVGPAGEQELTVHLNLQILMAHRKTNQK